MGKIFDRFDDYLVKATVMYESGLDERLHYVPDGVGEDDNPVRTSEVFDAFEKGLIIVTSYGLYARPVEIEEQNGEAYVYYISKYGDLFPTHSFPDLVE